MILGDHGPQTTIDEDLTALGMEHLLEGYGGQKKKKKKEMEAPGEEDGDMDEASSRQEIPVRQEDGEVDDDIEIDEDDDEDDDEIDEDDDEIDEDDEDGDSQLEAAFTVVERFQQKLVAVQEGDDDARPSYDDLVGVIESYECITSTADAYIAESHEYITEIVARIKGGQRIRGKEARKAGARQQAQTAAGPGAHLVQVGRRFVARGKAKGAKRLRGRRAGRKAHRGAGEAHKKKSMRRSQAARQHSSEENTGTPISELVQNLSDLREAVVRPAEVETDTGETMIEGLKSIHDTAVAFYERIANELQESEEIDEDDARIAMGRHLEAIAEDAHAVAGLIAEGEADMEDATDDLQNLAADLNDAMEAMKEIE